MIVIKEQEFMNPNFNQNKQKLAGEVQWYEVILISLSREECIKSYFSALSYNLLWTKTGQSVRPFQIA